MKLGLTENLGFILLIGKIGVGKTNLFQFVFGTLFNGTETVVIINTKVTAEQLLNFILSEFELKRLNSDNPSVWEIYYGFMIQKYAGKKECC